MSETAEKFVSRVRTLRRQREIGKAAAKSKGLRRRALRADDRRRVLEITGGRCHICGGSVDGQRWQADHVLAHSGGGDHSIDNYLPAHSLCNNYRWDFLAEEFQLILRLGVWIRTHIEKRTLLGRAAAVAFTAHERRRASRSKSSPRQKT